MKFSSQFLCILSMAVVCGTVSATTYSMPKTPGDSVIIEHPEDGDVSFTRSQQDETLIDVARQFLLGQTEIVRLNPDLDRWLIKKDTIIVLPNKRILPEGPRNGIVLNLSEFRLYFYQPNGKNGAPVQVRSYAHGVGRQDWKTPLGETRIVKKVKNPSWYPPESIRQEHAANGDPLPTVVGPGPNNPLGSRALHLALKGEYRIHGTDIDKIYGIGMQITHGCIRLYPENIEALYDLVSEGTPVYLVKQPIKVGWLDNKLYVEAHPDLEGDETTHEQRFALALSLIMKANKGELPDFDKAALDQVLTELRGIPTAIYERLPPLEDEVVPDVVAAPAPVSKTPAKVAVNKPGKQLAVISKKSTAVAINKTAKPVTANKAANKTAKSSAKTVSKIAKSTAKTASKTVSPGYYRGSL